MNNCEVCNSHCKHEMNKRIQILENQCDMILNKIKASLNSKTVNDLELTENELNSMYDQLFQLKLQVHDLSVRLIQQEMKVYVYHFRIINIF